MKVLLDVCALVELRDPQGDENVKEAIAAIRDDDLHLSSLTVGELARAIALSASGRKKRALNAWLDALEQQFGERILPVDAKTAHLGGELSARLAGSNRLLRPLDCLLAATALSHGLRIMTRRTSRFDGTGVLIENPWSPVKSQLS